MCRDELGTEYLKSMEISPQGIYKVERLTDAIEHYYLELRNGGNPIHMLASGWIAVPAEVSLEEGEAAKLLLAAGAWNQVKVAALNEPPPGRPLAAGRPGWTCRPAELKR